MAYRDCMKAAGHCLRGVGRGLEYCEWDVLSWELSAGWLKVGHASMTLERHYFH